MGRVIWKFDDYTSRVDQSRELQATYYGPLFYLPRFGYKMQLILVTETSAGLISMYIGCLKDDCQTLLERPFCGDITFFTSDAGEQVS